MELAYGVLDLLLRTSLMALVAEAGEAALEWSKCRKEEVV